MFICFQIGVLRKEKLKKLSENWKFYGKRWKLTIFFFINGFHWLHLTDFNTIILIELNSGNQFFFVYKWLVLVTQVDEVKTFFKSCRLRYGIKKLYFKTNNMRVKLMFVLIYSKTT